MRTARPVNAVTVAGILLAVAAIIAGCGCATDGALATRAKAHVRPIKPVIEHGIATFPGGTDDDRKVWREHMTQLDRLLDAGGAK